MKAYKKETNFCNELYKKERKKYYSKLPVNNIAEIENFAEPLTLKKSLMENFIFCVVSWHRNSKFDNHSSVKLIRHNITLSGMFQFESVSFDDTLKNIRNLSSAKNGNFKMGVLKTFKLVVWRNLYLQFYFNSNLE